MGVPFWDQVGQNRKAFSGLAVPVWGLRARSCGSGGWIPCFRKIEILCSYFPTLNQHSSATKWSYELRFKRIADLILPFYVFYFSVRIFEFVLLLSADSNGILMKTSGIMVFGCPTSV